VDLFPQTRLVIPLLLTGVSRDFDDLRLIDPGFHRRHASGIFSARFPPLPEHPRRSATQIQPWTLSVGRRMDGNNADVDRCGDWSDVVRYQSARAGRHQEIH